MDAGVVSDPGDSCPEVKKNNGLTDPDGESLSVVEIFPRIFGWRKNRDGSVAVEFGLTAIPFFLLVVGLLETSLLYAAATTLEGGTVAASRLIRTGQAQASGDPQTVFEDLLCEHVNALIPCEELVYEAIVPPGGTFGDAEGLPPQFDGDGNLIPGGFDAGGVSDVVVIRTSYRYRFITPFVAPMFSNNFDNSTTLMSTVTIRNEPYEFEE